MAKRGERAKQLAARYKTKIKARRTRPYHPKPHHKKGYRKRHFGLLSLSIILVVVILLQLGVIIGRNTVPSAHPVSDQARPTNAVTSVRSAYGFALAFDSNLYAVDVTSLNAKGNVEPVAFSELRNGHNITSVTVRSLPGTASLAEKAARLSIKVDPDKDKLQNLRNQTGNGTKTDAQLAALAFPVPANPDYDINIISQGPDTINGVQMLRTVYQYTANFGTSSNSYEVDWTGAIGGRAAVIRLQGLVGDSNIPAVFQPIFDTFNLSAEKKVEGVSTFVDPKASAASTGLSDKYLSDFISPSVVKIYHIICANLIVEGVGQTKYCDGVRGSGFIVTNDGYIATNGHVVVTDAREALVNAAFSSPANLEDFLGAAGLSAAQIAAIENDPQAQADLVAKLYDLPESDIRLENTKDLVFVELGDDTFDPKSITNVEAYIDGFKDTTTVKRASVIGFDYTSKDMNVNLYTGKGFTANDVALIKVGVTGMPALSLANSSHVRQNQQILLFGYPGDADNPLVDNLKPSVSVTNGTISAIRSAAGNNSRLFQSDADASHGNSGGPAVTGDGQVFGILTYRYQDPEAGDAAKSYIRDIQSLQELATKNSVTLDGESQTLDAWRQGLTYFSQDRFSKAIAQFAKVKTAYPQQRLVGEYITQAQLGIKEGKDVKDVPPIVLLLGMVIAVGGVVTAVAMIIVHRRNHLNYQAYHGLPGHAPMVGGAAIAATVPGHAPVKH